MGENKDNKKGKIEVDKDFLMKVLEAVNDVKESFLELKRNSVEAPTPSVNISPQPGHIFQCSKLISTDKRPTTPEEITHYQQVNKEFEAELQPLMRKYKVIQLTAMFLKKL